ncbi:unnamed protein product [Acanthoscelides obtectus]|uniref:DJ-1/PfpI domain-containing protein n=1 Tax=Acanthoscelides obtectus TaxID=200917 RepID=A0A9P0M818_ACAOB|nr:unnamed protein product [Acanthoscelides obtectus]CAK1658376.1 Protein dj-1beta [Acanthoscelides obtectus]
MFFVYGIYSTCSVAVSTDGCYPIIDHMLTCQCQIKINRNAHMLIKGFRAVLPVLGGRIFTNQRCQQFSECKTMAKKACVFLAPGAEEMEFTITADILVRGGIQVTVAGLPDDSVVECSRGINIKPTVAIANAKSGGPYDVLVLPGGLGGSKALASSKEVGEMLKEQEQTGRLIAAICAAPTALKAHGIAVGKKVTSYPSMKAQMEEGGQYTYLEDKVVIDGNIITSRGPGTAFEFGLALVEKLVGKEKKNEVAKGLLLSC